MCCYRCAHKKLPAARWRWGQWKWLRAAWPAFFARPQPPCGTVQCHSDTKSAVVFVCCLVTLSISTMPSHPSHFLHGLRLKLWCGCGACGDEMDGSERTAVSSNCKILVILDSGLWLMGLIWRLPRFGPPLNTGGREGIGNHGSLRGGRAGKMTARCSGTSQEMQQFIKIFIIIICNNGNLLPLFQL